MDSGSCALDPQESVMSKSQFSKITVLTTQDAYFIEEGELCWGWGVVVVVVFTDCRFTALLQLVHGQ